MKQLFCWRKIYMFRIFDKKSRHEVIYLEDPNARLKQEDRRCLTGNTSLNDKLRALKKQVSKNKYSKFKI